MEAIRNGADTVSLRGMDSAGKYAIPETLLDIPGLRHLHLKDFQQKIPAWISDITSLESLEIEQTGSVRELLPLLWKLEHLRRLKLAFTWEEHLALPASLARLRYLKELNIDGADFESYRFPAVIASLASLQSFSYLFCESALPDVFDTLSALPLLRKLSLTHNPDSFKVGDFLPESFYRLSAIEELHFNQWYCLEELPERIGEMQRLRVINLSNDDYRAGVIAVIRALPESLCSLVNLEELDLYGLQNLKQLPSGFSRLSRLKRLDTMCSAIEELQLTPRQWQNLESLHAWFFSGPASVHQPENIFLLSQPRTH